MRGTWFGKTIGCYAPGDGALSLNFFKNGKVLNRVVKQEDAEAYLKSRDELVKRGFRTAYLNKQWRLVRRVTRINAFTLRLDGEEENGEYQYSIDPDKCIKQVTDYALTITFLYKGLKHNVINSNIRDAVKFFLNNEEYLSDTE